jgi:dolichol-phosphate mannosyltransferase
MRQLTLIVPTYNEAQNLPVFVQGLIELDIPGFKLIIVDDNSPDGTGQLADQLAAHYGARIEVLHRAGKLGLGSAYIQGFQHALRAGAGAIGQMDADFSHPLEKIPLLLQALSSYDIAIGSRYVPGGSVDIDWPVWRKSLSAFGNFYARTILRLPLRDATGGFRIWRSETLKSMPLDRVRSNGYAFQIEIAYIAHRLGFSCCELPIYFADRQWGQSKMSFRIQREAALRVWQILQEYRDLTPALESPPHAVL